MNRRDFLKSAAGAGASAITITAGCTSQGDEEDEYERDTDTLYPNTELIQSIDVEDSGTITVQFAQYDAVEGQTREGRTYSAQVQDVAIARNGSVVNGTEVKQVVMGAPKYTFTPTDLPDGQYRLLAQTKENNGWRVAEIRVAFIQPFTIANGRVQSLGKPRLHKFGNGDAE